MIGISDGTLQFPDEIKLRKRLVRKGIKGPAQDRLVLDEAANRKHAGHLASMSSQVWDTGRAYVLAEMVKKNSRPQELPAPELIAGLTRLVLSADICSNAGQRHPALASLCADKQGSQAMIWSEAISVALSFELEHSDILMQPHASGALCVACDNQSEPGGASEILIPAAGDGLLPRTWLVALVVEVLHCIAGTRRRYDLPTTKLQGVHYTDSGAEWSKLLDPVFDAGAGSC